MGKKAKRRNTDPRKLPGSFVGPGGPHDEGGVIIDAANAVLLDAASVARVDELSNVIGSDVIAMVLSGRMVHRKERADVLFMMDHDGVAALLTEIYGLIGRMGHDAIALKADIEERVAKLQAEGLMDDHHHHHHHHREEDAP